MDLTSQKLFARLAPALVPDARGWLASTLADSALLVDARRLRVAFAQAARKLGPGAQAQAAEGELPVLDLARASLLLAALELLPASGHEPLVDTLYRTGEQREQQSILRALPLLPDAARFSAVAIHACRTNSLEVFRAIATDNSYPGSHFPELHFNQLVLKAIFLAVPVARILQLDERATPELGRMLREYASERRAAGRAIPTDVDYVIALSER